MNPHSHRPHRWVLTCRYLVVAIAAAALGCGEAARDRVHEALDRAEETASQIHALLEEEGKTFAEAGPLGECPSDWQGSRDHVERSFGRDDRPDLAEALDKAYDLWSECLRLVNDFSRARRQNEVESQTYELAHLIGRIDDYRESLADVRVLSDDISWYINERADSDQEVLDRVVQMFGYYPKGLDSYMFAHDHYDGERRTQLFNANLQRMQLNLGSATFDLLTVRQRIADRTEVAEESTRTFDVNLRNLEAAIVRVRTLRNP